MKKRPPVRQPSYLKQAIKYVEYWVPRLRLENYEIEVAEAPEDFEDFAQCIGDVCHLRARLVFKDPEKVDKKTLACRDLEVTVVHELIHVRFGEIIRELDGKAHYANEAATEMLAMALVAARRGIRNPRTLYGL